MRTSKHSPLWQGALVLSALVVAAPSIQAETLRWKLKPGDTLHYVIEQKSVSTLKENGKEVRKSSISKTIDLSRSVKRVDGSGNAEMTQKFERVRIHVDTGLQKIDFDSDQDDDRTNARMMAPLKAMVGAEFTFKMTPEGAVSDVQIPAKVAKALREGAGSSGSAEPFSEDKYKKAMVDASVAFPKTDLAKGQSWSQIMTVPVPPLGTETHTKTYTLEGPGDAPGVQKIGLDIKVELKRDPSTPESDIKPISHTIKGTFLFDNEAGRMTSSDVLDKNDVAYKFQNADITSTEEQTSTMKLVPGTSEKKP